MKYFVGLLVVLLIAGGVFLGIKIGKDSHTVTTTSPSGTQTTTSDGVVLDLSNKGLTKVDSSIYGKTGTNTLILSNNSIKTLPSELGRMNQLTVFKIDHNLLDGSLIGEVRQMSQLKTLDVSYNRMTGVPAELGQLSHLESLNYSYNQITGLPNELADLKNNLKEFTLTGNPLKADQISKLKAELPNTTIIF